MKGRLMAHNEKPEHQSKTVRLKDGSKSRLGLQTRGEGAEVFRGW